MKRKQITLKAIRPNAGIHNAYRAELNALLRELRDEVQQAVESHKNSPVLPVALDAHPLVAAIDRLMVRWITKMGDLGDRIAQKFVKGSLNYYDRNIKKQLRDAGMTVRLQMTPVMAESLQASMGMNVGLIKSIPQQYLGDVAKYVHEAMAGGFDLATLTDNLQHAYKISRNRAAFIARDQANKANSVIERARRLELGIKKAQWLHSSAAKVPRPSHVKAHGKIFDIEKGCYIEGEYIQAGEKINCGCISRSIIEV